MFYPFRDENLLKVTNSFFQNLVEEGVLYTINEKKKFFDSNREEINNTFLQAFLGVCPHLLLLI